jgi:hypothetical protein
VGCEEGTCENHARAAHQGGNHEEEDFFHQTALLLAQKNNQSKAVRLLQVWPNIRAVWVLRSAQIVSRLGNVSALKFIPKELVRMVLDIFSNKCV